MERGKKNIIYTAEDIQKYFSGKLDALAMHAMEKAALDDAFLAEAMEGYETMKERDWEKHLIALKHQFKKEQSSPVIEMKNTPRFGLWKAAAAILIICCGIVISYMLTTSGPTKNKSIAAISAKQDSANNVVTEIHHANDSNTSKIAPVVVNTNPKTKHQYKITTRSGQHTLPDSSFVYRPAATTDKKEAIQDTGGGYVADQLKGRNDYTTRNATASAPQNRLNRSEIKSNKVSGEMDNKETMFIKGTPLMRKFIAQVVDRNGIPLPFSNIRITGEKPGTYADAGGNISLESPEPVLNIAIKSAGYIHRNIVLRSDTVQNKIVLAEDPLALKDKAVVVIGYGTKRRPASEPRSLYNAEPADGWKNYAIYINNNLSIPGKVIQEKIHGEVEISFEVQSNGVLSNLKVEKSLCDECDVAALRVIKEGPGWKVINGSKATAKVTVKF